MTDRIPPIGPVSGVGGATSGGPVTPVVTATTGDRRGRERRSAERRARDEAKKDAGGKEKAASTSRALVPVGKPVHHDPAGPAASKRPLTEAQAAAAAFAAQMLGQGGQRNGIKGGPTVMDAARSTYLNAEYAGEKERRPPVGATRRKDI